MPTLDVAINALRAKHGAKQFDDAAKKIRRSAKNVDKDIRTSDKAIGHFSKQAKTMALGLVGVAAAYKGLRFAVSSVKEFAAFEMGLANVSTMLDDSTMKYMPQYEKQLKKMAREFGQSTDTLSKGLYDILSASISAEKSIKVLRVSSKAAIAGLTDTGIAADALTTILNSYGLEAEAATEIGDILFATVKAGKITFGELAGSIGKVSALAAAIGLDFTELSAAISTMTRNGVQADMAMTALRAIMVTFLQPQADAVKIAKKFNLELSANTIRTIGLTGALQKLTDATEEEIAGIFKNQRALVGIAPLRNNLTALITDQETALNSLGMQEEAYQKIADKTGIKLKQLAEDWKAVKVASGGFAATMYDEYKQSLIALISIGQAQTIAGRIPKVEKITLPSLEFLGKQPKEVIEDLIKELEDKGLHVPGKIRQLLEPVGQEVEQIIAEVDKLAMFKDLEKKFYISPEAEKTLATERAKIRKEEVAEDEKNMDNKAQALRRLYNDLEQMDKTHFDFRQKLLDTELLEYEKYIDNKALLNEWYAGRKAEIDNQMAIASDNFFTGFGASVEQMENDMTTWGEVGASAAQTLKSATSDAIVSMTSDWSTWESALSSIGDSVLRTTQKMIADMITMQLISAAIGGFSGMFGGGALASAPVQPTGQTVFAYPSVKGNVFSHGSIVPFAKGDILNHPTIFPMSNGGIGLAGEAGKEAIMPLGRDNQGRLGVRTNDSESKQAIKIYNIMDFSQVVEYLNSGDGERQIINIMRRNANELQGISG